MAKNEDIIFSWIKNQPGKVVSAISIGKEFSSISIADLLAALIQLCQCELPLP